MGGLIGSIFDLSQGDPTSNEQKQFGGLSAFETGTGESLTNAGAGVEEGILSGDPSKIAQIEAPEINAQQGQIEQNNLKMANFGNRSGGTNASTQAAPAAARGNIFDLTGGLIGNTAGAAVGQGSGLLGQASSNTGQEAELANQRRQQVVGDVNGIAAAAGEIASPFLTPAEAQPPQTPQMWAPSDYLQQTGNNLGLATDDEVGADPFGWNS